MTLKIYSRHEILKFGL